MGKKSHKKDPLLSTNHPQTKHGVDDLRSKNHYFPNLSSVKPSSSKTLFPGEFPLQLAHSACDPADFRFADGHAFRKVQARNSSSSSLLCSRVGTMRLEVWKICRIKSGHMTDARVQRSGYAGVAISTDCTCPICLWDRLFIQSECRKVV